MGATSFLSLKLRRYNIKYIFLTKMTEMEVDFDTNVTELYSAIQKSEWDIALAVAKESPDQARTWVVRYHPNNEIMWRFLPLHSAAAKNPPGAVITALINAYKEGSQRTDDQGMLPIHYACGNQASLEVIRQLLFAFSAGASTPDPNGMLPIHYLAQWGPSSLETFELLLRADKNAAFAKDVENFSPLDLALQGEYPEKDNVVRILHQLYESQNPAIHSPEMERVNSDKKPSDAIRRMEEAAAARDKAREEYTHKASPYGDSRDDDIVKSTPKSTHAFSFRDDYLANDDFQMSIDEGKKIVSELKLEVEQLKKESERADAEASKNISAEKTKMQLEIEEMKSSLGQKKEKLKAARDELAEKERVSKSVEVTLEGKENQLNAATKKNEELRKQLETVRRQISSYKVKTSNLDNHLETLSRTMQTMIKEHEEIMRVSIAHEEHAKVVQVSRQKKMQELIDQEVEFARKSLEKHKNSDLGSDEAINQALEKQKGLMSSISSILSERA